MNDTRRASRTSVIATRIGRVARSAVEPIATAATSPVVTTPGFALATCAGRAWGRLLGGREERAGELYVITGLPSWAFGRGGTCVGAAYLTNTNVSAAILEHEDVHRQQWQRYGLAFIPLYFAAGLDGKANRFEIEAGLSRGGYV